MDAAGRTKNLRTLPGTRGSRPAGNGKALSPSPLRAAAGPTGKRKTPPASFAGWRCLFGQAFPQGHQENEDVQDPHGIASLFLKKRATEVTRQRSENQVGRHSHIS